MARRHWMTMVLGGAGILALGCVAAFAASSDATVRAGDELRVRCEGNRITSTRIDQTNIVIKCQGSTATPTPTRTNTVAAAATRTNTPLATATGTNTPTRTSTNTPARTPTSVPPTPTPTVIPSTGSAPNIGGCQVFPANNPWNTDISSYAVHPNSAAYIAKIDSIASNNSQRYLHADFGGNGEYGIPYMVVPATQALAPITWTAYGNESDPGPYPIPQNAPVENGSDAHVLVVRQGECKLYELYAASPNGTGWNAASGAIWNLSSNALRTEGWTSADAAGLPVLAGLARYDEVAAGSMRHALRFTVNRTLIGGYIHPATHWAGGDSDPNLPPMGLRLRLRADFNISGYTGQSRVILETLKKYGMIIADNGSNDFITGARDTRWNDDDLNQLKLIPTTAFEVVNTGPITAP